MLPRTVALLDGLDQVRWSKLGHAYGPARDVPDLLRALVDPSRAPAEVRDQAQRLGRGVRDQVMRTLYGNLYHQGTVWQATPRALPFLVELLRDGPPDHELRRFLLEYLHHLGLRYPGVWFPDLLDPDTQFRDADPPPPRPRGRNHTANLVRYARDCYRAVAAALPVIARFADDDHDDVAVRAIALLGAYRGELSVAALGAVAATGRSTLRRAIAFAALAPLAPAAVVGATALLDDGDPPVAIHAAAALLVADPAREDALRVLVRPLGGLGEAHTPLSSSLATLVSRCLARVPADRADTAIQAMADILATASPSTSLSVTEAMLRLGFPGHAVPGEAGALTGPQRKALAAIAAHGGFGCRGGYLDYDELVRSWGLPDEPEPLTAWLASPPAS